MDPTRAQQNKKIYQALKANPSLIDSLTQDQAAQLQKSVDQHLQAQKNEFRPGGRIVQNVSDLVPPVQTPQAYLKSLPPAQPKAPTWSTQPVGMLRSAVAGAVPMYAPLAGQAMTKMGDAQPGQYQATVKRAVQEHPVAHAVGAVLSPINKIFPGGVAGGMFQGAYQAGVTASNTEQNPFSVDTAQSALMGGAMGGIANQAFPPKPNLGVQIPTQSGTMPYAQAASRVSKIDSANDAAVLQIMDYVGMRDQGIRRAIMNSPQKRGQLVSWFMKTNPGLTTGRQVLGSRAAQLADISKHNLVSSFQDVKAGIRPSPGGPQSIGIPGGHIDPKMIRGQAIERMSNIPGNEYGVANPASAGGNPADAMVLRQLERSWSSGSNVQDPNVTKGVPVDRIIQNVKDISSGEFGKGTSPLYEKGAPIYMGTAAQAQGLDALNSGLSKYATQMGVAPDVLQNYLKNVQTNKQAQLNATRLARPAKQAQASVGLTQDIWKSATGPIQDRLRSGYIARKANTAQSLRNALASDIPQLQGISGFDKMAMMRELDAIAQLPAQQQPAQMFRLAQTNPIIMQIKRLVGERDNE